jgi:hypothetical protein
MTFREVVESHPQPTSLDREALLRCSCKNACDDLLAAIG